jgi:hypothetical protein
LIIIISTCSNFYLIFAQSKASVGPLLYLGETTATSLAELPAVPEPTTHLAFGASCPLFAALDFKALVSGRLPGYQRLIIRGFLVSRINQQLLLHYIQAAVAISTTEAPQF